MTGGNLKARELLHKFKNSTCTPEELDLLHNWYLGIKSGDLPSDLEIAADLLDLQTRGRVITQKRAIRIPYRIWGLRVAVLVVFFSLGVWLWTTYTSSSEENSLEAATHILPGTKHAKIYIDGDEFPLDSTTNSIRMIKGSVFGEDGEIIKNLNEENTIVLETPRGSQFKAILPDGSRVWLNAESSIKYPSQFDKKNRTVDVTGEVFIEVTPDKSRPFLVNSSHQLIEVRGTSFNVDAYADNGTIRTTLVEGSLKITHTSTGQSLLIKPSQQSTLSESGNFTVENVEAGNYSSWKDGIYMINNQPLEEFGKQIERWYNIEVDMGKHKDKALSAIIRRDVTLKEVLEAIELKTGIQFKMKERRVNVIN